MIIIFEKNGNMLVFEFMKRGRIFRNLQRDKCFKFSNRDFQ